jgi:hypothetical protein
MVTPQMDDEWYDDHERNFENRIHFLFLEIRIADLTFDIEEI